VPVIAVFTKYDQFRRELSFHLEDLGRDPRIHLEHEAESVFRKNYLVGICRESPFVRLQSEDLLSTVPYYTDFCPTEMHIEGQKCTELINTTISALSSDVIAFTLLAVQKFNLEPNITQAIKW
jgi:hypothetical protein